MSEDATSYYPPAEPTEEAEVTETETVVTESDNTSQEEAAEDEGVSQEEAVDLLEGE